MTGTMTLNGAIERNVWPSLKVVSKTRFVVGIDASNIRAGGGVTHLQQLLRVARPQEMGVERVILWGGTATLSRMPDQDWIEKRYVPALDRILPWRVAWQQFVLPRALRLTGCDALFSSGGTLPIRRAVPAVTMSQNMLPFEAREARRFGYWSWMYWKLRLLRSIQFRSFQSADGVIFLSEYARRFIVSRARIRRDTVIPHGAESRFFLSPRSSPPAISYSQAKPFRFLYVSIIDVYKHQECVAQAVALLRARGLPIEIDFIGPAYPPALKRLEAVIQELDPNRRFLHYRGAVPFEDLHHAYANADAFVFASSCENLPNILIEAMAAGLAIACSRCGPMPETLGDAGLYFDPENVNEIATVLERLFSDDSLRATMARDAHARAKSYSWERAAQATFAFIHQVAESRVTL